jgi:hypothetical protein
MARIKEGPVREVWSRHRRLVALPLLVSKLKLRYALRLAASILQGGILRLLR